METVGVVKEAENAECLSPWEIEMRKPVASDDYLSLTGIAPTRVRAVLAGIPRSGTVFLWQMLRDLFPEGGVIHTHEYLEPPGVPVICTYRDPRDCLASHWRRDRPEGAGHAPREKLFWYAGMMHRFAWIFRQYRQRCSPLILKYENVISSELAVLQMMADHVGRTPRHPRRIVRRHSLDANRRLQQKSKRGEFNPETMLHSRHVGTGGVGAWRELIAERDWGLMHELLMPLMHEWGYDN